MVDLNVFFILCFFFCFCGDVGRGMSAGATSALGSAVLLRTQGCV